jgi:hypothetical protein
LITFILRGIDKEINTIRMWQNDEVVDFAKMEEETGINEDDY